MSISISVVSNMLRPFSRYAEVLQITAEVRSYVKTIAGSCYAIDRRTGPVGPEAPPPEGSMPTSPVPVSTHSLPKGDVAR